MDCEHSRELADEEIIDEMEICGGQFFGNEIESTDHNDNENFIKRVFSFAMNKPSFLSINEEKVKSNSNYYSIKENFMAQIQQYEEREWEQEEHTQCLEELSRGEVNLDEIEMMIRLTGPFDWSSKEALVLMVCAGLISRINTLFAAQVLEDLELWNRRRDDSNSMHLLLTRSIFREVLRLSLTGKLHFRADYGRNIESTFSALQQRSKLFHMEEQKLHETVDTVLQQMKNRKFEIVLDTLLNIWALYCKQDEHELEFFKNAFNKYCARFKQHKQDILGVWDAGMDRWSCRYRSVASNHYLNDPIESLTKWAEEDCICANDRYHSSSKPSSDEELISKQFNLTECDKCLRELSLMNGFDMSDVRTTNVFKAIKCLGLGDVLEASYLEEWCSRYPSFQGSDSVRNLLSNTEQYSSAAEALNVLHHLRCENPVLVFRNFHPLLDSSTDSVQTKEQQSKKRFIHADGSLDSVETHTPKKKTKKEKLSSQEQSHNESDTENGSDSSSDVLAKKDASTKFLYRLIHSLDHQRMHWSALLSILFQLYQEEKEEILKFITTSYKIERSIAEKRWNAKEALCLNWGRFIKQRVDVDLSGQKLLTHTIPAMLGSNVLMYAISEQFGCKELRMVTDTFPLETYSLNLNTGLINDDVKLNLNMIGNPAECSDFSLADLLIERGLKDRLGFYEIEKSYFQFAETNGAWHKIENDQALRLIGNELAAILSSALNFMKFREFIGISEVPKGFYNICSKYSGALTAVDHVLKAALPLIRFESPNKDPHRALFKNGLVDLRKKQLLGPAKPGEYFIHSIPNEYNPDADQTLVQTYVGSFFPDTVYDDGAKMRAFYQMHLGSFLTTAKISPAVAIFVGQGSNGKSGLCKGIRDALGKEYHATIAAEAMEKDPGTNNDNLFRNRNARAATIMEIEKGRKLNTKQLKTLTGGDESEVSGKFKIGDGVETSMSMAIFTNYTPSFTSKISDDFGLSRRLCIVPLRVQFLDDNDEQELEKLKSAGHEHWAFPKNETLEKQLITEGIAGILAFMVDGASMLFANDCKLLLPPTVRTATNKEKEVDCLDESIQDFVRTNLTVIHSVASLDNGARPFIPTQEMIEVYKRLHGIESCLFKDLSFAEKLKAAIIDVFIAPHLQSSGRLKVECGRNKGAHDVFVQAQVEHSSKPKVEYGKKKGVETSLGKTDLRGYYNLLWTGDSVAVVTEIRKSYHRGRKGCEEQAAADEIAVEEEKAKQIELRKKRAEKMRLETLRMSKYDEIERQRKAELARQREQWSIEDQIEKQQRLAEATARKRFKQQASKPLIKSRQLHSFFKRPVEAKDSEERHQS